MPVLDKYIISFPIEHFLFLVKILLLKNLIVVFFILNHFN